MKRLFFLLILATALVGCGSSQAAQPTPTPVNHQATASAIQTAISASLYATAVASLAATQTAVVKYGITPTIDTPTPAPTTQSDIGSTQQSDVWSVTLNSVKTSHGDVVAPKTGDIFVLFNLTARNTDTSNHLISVIDFSLHDSDGNAYTYGAMAIQQLSGTVFAGQQLRSDVVFEIAQSAHQLTLQFDPSFDPNQAVQWNVTI